MEQTLSKQSEHKTLSATKLKTVNHRASSERTKTKLLNSALTLFGQYGYDHVSVRMIGRAANVNHAMIRYYFTSKDELWSAAIHWLFDRLNSFASERRPKNYHQLTEKDKARVLIGNYVEYCSTYPEHARIMVQENMRPSERMLDTADRVRKSHENIASVLENCMAEGVLPKLPVVNLIYAIVGMCQMPFMLKNEVKQVHNIDCNSRQMIDAHCNTVIQLIFREEPIPNH